MPNNRSGGKALLDQATSGSAGLQDLPESKYPRSYTPRMRKELMDTAYTATGGLSDVTGDALQTGEKVVAGKRKK